MTTWSQFQQIQFVDWQKGDTGDVSESEGDTIVLYIISRIIFQLVVINL